MNVATLQSKLQALGFYVGRIDGINGSQTQQAVLDFQLHMAEFKLKADGIAGSLTQAALLKAVPDLAPRLQIKGVDLSHHNSQINFDQAKREGQIDFAFIKASEGNTYRDPLFKQNLARAKAAGIIVGVYHFFHPSMDPIAQAKHFCEVTGPLENEDMPSVLDWEIHEGRRDQESPKAMQFLDHVAQVTGKMPMIYSGNYFINEDGNTPGLEKYPLWIAHWNVKQPKVPRPWSNWTFWQTGIGSNVPGIQGKVDMDVFNGSLDELKAFCAGQVKVSVV